MEKEIILEWTRIKTKHFLYSEYTLLERGALSTLLCLTAHLERMPTEKEMLKEVSGKLLQSISDKLARYPEDYCNTIAKVLERVVQDACKVSADRVANKKRVAKSRDTEICNALQDQRRNATDKIREDKIREDNNKKESIEKKDFPLSFDEETKKKLNNYFSTEPAKKIYLQCVDFYLMKKRKNEHNVSQSDYDQMTGWVLEFIKRKPGNSFIWRQHEKIINQIHFDNEIREEDRISKDELKKALKSYK